MGTVFGFIQDKIEGIPADQLLSVTGLATELVSQFHITKTSAYNRINIIMKREQFKERFEKVKGIPKGMPVTTRKRTYIVRKKS